MKLLFVTFAHLREKTHATCDLHLASCEVNRV